MRGYDWLRQDNNVLSTRQTPICESAAGCDSPFPADFLIAYSTAACAWAINGSTITTKDRFATGSPAALYHASRRARFNDFDDMAKWLWNAEDSYQKFIPYHNEKAHCGFRIPGNRLCSERWHVKAQLPFAF